MTFRHDDASPDGATSDEGSADRSSAERSGGDAVGSFAEVEAQDDRSSTGKLSSSGADVGSDVGGPAGTMQSGVGSALPGDQPDEADDSQSRNPL